MFRYREVKPEFLSQPQITWHELFSHDAPKKVVTLNEADTQLLINTLVAYFMESWRLREEIHRLEILVRDFRKVITNRHLYKMRLQEKQ
jgi:hypothetical protein